MDIEQLHNLANSGDLIAYFGYGSLVNPLTHRTNVIHYERAALRGFARHWQARPDGGQAPIALLSAAPTEQANVLHGLLVFDYAENLPFLDERESGYDRLTLTSEQLALVSGNALPNCPLYVYSGRAPFAPEKQHFILQSYLDAVLQGFLHQYGEDGVEGFVANTANFDTTLLLDRDRPNYPRPVTLSASEVELIDRLTEFMARAPAQELIF